MVLVQKRPLQYRFENSSRLYPACVPLSRFVAVETRILEKCARTLESPLAIIPEGEIPQLQPLVRAEQEEYIQRLTGRGNYYTAL